jgi:hypothetical protein
MIIKEVTMAERKYVLTIIYDKEKEQMEYLTEQVIEDEPEILVDGVDISQYWDEEGLAYIKDIYDVGVS